MKKLLLLVFVLGLFVIAGAQSNQFSLAGPVGAVTGCQAPAAGQNSLCSVTDGWYASINGASYVKIPLTQGSTGITGGSCASGTYMSGISAAGVPACTALPTSTPAVPASFSCGSGSVTFASCK